MTDKKEEQFFLSFYFNAGWRAFATIPLFLILVFLLLSNAGKIWLALRFIASVAMNSAQIQGISFLFWGLVLFLSLLVAVLAPLFLIFFFPKIWHSEKKLAAKISIIAAGFFALPFIIIIADTLAEYSLKQPAVAAFAVEHKIISVPQEEKPAEEAN